MAGPLTTSRSLRLKSDFASKAGKETGAARVLKERSKRRKWKKCETGSWVRGSLPQQL